MTNSGDLEPYKLSEIFSLIPEYDGDQIFLNTFTNACNCAYRMCMEEQRVLLTLHIKNKLRGRAAQLINSRDIQTWTEIRQLLHIHFGDSRDLTSLIQDLQRIHQLPNESPLTFVNRLQTHNAKMHACVQQQNLTTDQKEAQEQLIETMTLNTLLAGLEPKLGQIIRAGNPPDILTASMRIRRELQLSYFEKQKYSKSSSNNNNFKIQQRNQEKFCSYCKRKGHILSECRSKPNQTQYRSHTNQNQNTNNNSPYQFNRPQNTYQANQNSGNTFHRTNIPHSSTQRPNFQNSYQTRNYVPFQKQNLHFNEETGETEHENFQQVRHQIHPPGLNEITSQMRKTNISNQTEQRFM